MATIDDIRYENLRALISRYGGQRALADAIGKAPAQVSQWVTRAPNERGSPRVMSTGTARQIEDTLKLPTGWMDMHNATGQGPRERDAAAPPAAPALTPDERAMLDLWRGLGPDGKRSVQAVAHALAQPQVKRGKAR